MDANKTTYEYALVSSLLKGMMPVERKSKKLKNHTHTHTKVVDVTQEKWIG